MKTCSGPGWSLPGSHPLGSVGCPASRQCLCCCQRGLPGPGAMAAVHWPLVPLAPSTDLWLRAPAAASACPIPGHYVLLPGVAALLPPAPGKAQVPSLQFLLQPPPGGQARGRPHCTCDAFASPPHSLAGKVSVLAQSGQGQSTGGKFCLVVSTSWVTRGAHVCSC